MSGKILIGFEVANMTIMEETLKRLNHAFSKKNGSLVVKRNYYDIVIEKNNISCDSMNRNEVETIKAEYQRDFQVHERTLRGETFEVTETSNEIVIMVH
jgi:hypothetical protein